MCARVCACVRVRVRAFAPAPACQFANYLLKNEVGGDAASESADAPSRPSLLGEHGAWRSQKRIVLEGSG